MFAALAQQAVETLGQHLLFALHRGQQTLTLLQLGRGWQLGQTGLQLLVTLRQALRGAGRLVELFDQQLLTRLLLLLLEERPARHATRRRGHQQGEQGKTVTPFGGSRRRSRLGFLAGRGGRRLFDRGRNCVAHVSILCSSRAAYLELP